MFGLCALHSPHDMEQIFLGIQRVEICALPNRWRAADGFVAVEGAFQHALTTRQRWQLLL
jgi:hypothetical protein